jgi:hypothetical protein
LGAGILALSAMSACAAVVGTNNVCGHATERYDYPPDRDDRSRLEGFGCAQPAGQFHRVRVRGPAPWLCPWSVTKLALDKRTRSPGHGAMSAGSKAASAPIKECPAREGPSGSVVTNADKPLNCPRA